MPGLLITYMLQSGIMHLSTNTDGLPMFGEHNPICGARLMGEVVVLSEVVPQYSKCTQCTEAAVVQGLSR